MKLRDYQEKLVMQGLHKLMTYGLVYLAMEMRLGKTITALSIAARVGAKRVLFVTKKAAMASIEEDYKSGGFDYGFTLINYESLHKVNADYDLLIVDEAHSIGAYPKPIKAQKQLKEIVYKANIRNVIYLSGTPNPETYSQLFNQFAISPLSPWRDYGNFYKWAKDYVNVYERKINGILLKRYDRAISDKVLTDIRPYMVSYSQKEANFTNHEIREEIIKIEAPWPIQALMDRLNQDRYYKMRDEQEIVADTAVKLMSKLHQISSGTIITEAGVYKILSPYKAEYIRERFRGQKIAIYYKFVAEGLMLRSYFPNWTDDPAEFNKFDNRVYINQIQSGSMGVNLSSADCIIFFNIDFSAKQYFQARARLGSMTRTKPQVCYWLFSSEGIESKVYNAVIKKKSYTLNYFRKDYNVTDSVKYNAVSKAV